MALNNVVDNTTAQPQYQQPQQQATVQQGGKWSFHDQGLYGINPIAKGVGSEVYGKLKEALVEIYKKSDPSLEIALIDMDNSNESGLRFSAMIVAIRSKLKPKVGVAYHILVLEATGEKLTPDFDNVNGVQVEIYKVPSDAFDSYLISRAAERVRSAFPEGPWHFVDGTVVPAKFNVEDKIGLNNLAFNAGKACSTTLDQCSDGFFDLNLSALKHDSSLNINVLFARQQVQDIVGDPMRSDVIINFVSKKNTQNAPGRITPVNGGDSEARLAQTSGFIDLVYSPVADNAVMNPYQQQQVAAATQKYMARLIITNLVSDYACTPGAVLLALSTALALRDNNNWIQTYRPAPAGKNVIDIADIGAINIEANLYKEEGLYGTPINTKVNTFQLEQLGQLVSAVIQPGLVISLDCPDYAPQTWYMSLFSYAANGSEAARQIIIKAANELTNGAFGKYFTPGSEMFTDLGNRVHLGTWIDRDGVTRDIRDIDYLAVCNLSGNNPQLIRDWSETFLGRNYPIAMRMSARKKIIMGLTGDTAKITGFAHRVTPSKVFMNALAIGISETGMDIKVNTPLSGADFNNQRSVANFGGSALMQQGATFMSQGGFTYNNQQQFGGNNFRY